VEALLYNDKKIHWCRNFILDESYNKM